MNCFINKLKKALLLQVNFISSFYLWAVATLLCSAPMSSRPQYKFLKPGEASFSSDRSDADPTSCSSFIYNPNNKLPLDRQRQRLPIYAVKKHMLFLLERCQTLVIEGETGSGKSTQIPQYLLESGWCTEGMVGVTQPRRVACTSLASRVAEEQDCLLGTLVGYTIRFDDNTTPGQTKLKYMTEALLVREMMGDPLLRQYSVLMLDEVHERTLYTDILLGLLKKVLKRRKDLRVIICSATIDVHDMLHFFNFNKTADKSKDTAAVLSVTGRTFPVDVHYLQEACADYVKESARTVTAVHKTQPPGDVLVFLTGVEEVTQCVELIIQHLNTKNDNTGSMRGASVLPMHGSLSTSEQLRVFQSVGAGTRKIVVATNIAETSITIPGIVYVVDCGFMKLRVYSKSSASSNKEALTEGLSIVTTSKASATQRAGRAGRTRPGKVYRLYEESEYAALPDATPPEMLRTNLSPAVLNLLALGIDNMLRFEFPSPPPASHLKAALEELFAIGAITEGVALTQPLGQRMAEMPVPPQLAKMLLVSGEYGCREEIATVAAMLQVQSVLVTPHANAHNARKMHAKFQVEEGDLLTLLNVYVAWEREQRCKRWCGRHFVNHKSLNRASEIKSRILSLLDKWDVTNDQDIHQTTGGSSISSMRVRRCITAGLFCNAAYLHHSGQYRTVRSNTTLAIHPSSVLYTLQQPKWLVYNEVLHTNRAYMRDLTTIEEDWLTEIAPHFFQRRRVTDD
uniref:RNA helicase n=1 Tax=Hirondellea gigas TaxID=1518452 RepID=A0A2P2I9V6_9CRUS